ncbi:hypothetical protein [Actinopolymorpha rutila]|uniref:Uncharacterized protein n=1 Tax=Actinopolymorpha rutila TaxID=446787 RepID=A0A852ZHW3_9ACTN|nr:hypothetical protein [Actinopolymorpha rutila]NYH87876.1 hypothetical protein [Actinopolymorpha rutila]
MQGQTLHLPAVRYAVTADITTPAKGGGEPDEAVLAQPLLTVGRDTRLVLDARAARPVSVRVPDSSARIENVNVAVSVGDRGAISEFQSLAHLHTAQIGPSAPANLFTAEIEGVWARPDADGDFRSSPYAYMLSWFSEGGFFNGLSKAPARGDLARVRSTQQTLDRFGYVYKGYLAHSLHGVEGVRLEHVTREGATLTEYYSTGVGWETLFGDIWGDAGALVSRTTPQVRHFQPGGDYRDRWGAAVLGPAFLRPQPGQAPGVARTAAGIDVDVPMYVDGDGHPGEAGAITGSTTLYRNGAKVGTSDARGSATFSVPAQDATYRLDTTVTHPPAFLEFSPRIDTSWTFRSAAVSDGTPRALPVSAIRFHPRVDARNHLLPGGSAMHVTVERQPGAERPGRQKLSVSASFDDGHTWRQVAVAPTAHEGDWLARVPRPSKPGYVSLRAVAADGHAGSVRQTIIRAYAG